MTGSKRHAAVVLATLLAAGVAAGCSSGSESASTATPAAPRATTSTAAGSATAIAANVPGTYSNGDWVVRLKADGTWEEDLRGQVNAYGGTYTVDGEKILLRDRRGSSETAVLTGDELQLPSITLRRQ